MEEIFEELFVNFRALSLVYQQIHWIAKNTVSFQDHLLAARLYEESNAEIDTIAEKSVGVTQSTKSIDLKNCIKEVFVMIKDFPSQAKENGELFKVALGMEKDIIKCCTEYEVQDKISLGLKNLLADLADKTESRVYLLQQRLNK